ncbi:MAG: hypothetical protein MIO92_02595, partial [Methanosarcinaceae archaeon]|nr:hypothetical protein [Methanosarcinaceae archaeon]
TRITNYLTYGFIVTFSEIPNTFLNESGPIRITILFEQNIHGFIPSYESRKGIIDKTTRDEKRFTVNYSFPDVLISNLFDYLMTL